MNIGTSFKYAAFAATLAMAIPAVAQNSSLRDLANMASAAADAAREGKEQAAAPEAVKAIFAKAEAAAEDGAINFCGFYPGMSEADARTLVAHYGLKDGQWGVDIVPSTKEVSQLSFTLRSVRRITKGGDTFDELSQAVANRIGTMERKRNSDYDLVGYEYKTIDGQTGFISEKEGLFLTDPTLMRKAALAKLPSDMVPIPGRAYAMCKYEVTQALCLAVLGENPSRFKGPDRPLENVTWDDCKMFLDKLNALPEVKASGRAYRLPTADEWEYACRAGATGDYCKLADGTEITEETLGEVAWYIKNSSVDGNSGIDVERQTHPVCQKKPNAFGLYDMLGNVDEWTSTVDDDDRDKLLYIGGSFRYPCFYCGGSWNSFSFSCTAGKRNREHPLVRAYNRGFRLAYTCGTETERKAAAERRVVADSLRKALAGARRGANAESAAPIDTEPTEKDFTPEFVAKCKERAEVGDAQGQALYGRALSNGWGVEKDQNESIKWLKMSADAGNLIGITSLSQCLRFGNGIEKDIPKANELLVLAATRGFPRAQFLVGTFLQSGGGENKEREAVEWYTKAAEQGYALAQCDLGFCYQFGEGVEKNPAKAVEWFRKAAEQGDARAQCYLGDCYMLGEGVKQEPAKAVEWYRKAAAQGYARAQFNLGVCYEEDATLEKDRAKAVEWYRKAAAQGYARAKKALQKLGEPIPNFQYQ